MRMFAYSHTEAGIRARAAQRQQTIAGSTTSPKAAPAPKPSAKASNVVPMFTVAVNLMIKRRMPAWARRVTIEVACKHQIHVFDMIGAGRSRHLVAARAELFYLLRMDPTVPEKMRPSWPTLSSWFNRDHSGVLYAAATYAARNGLPMDTSTDALKMRADRQRRHRERKEKARAQQEPKA